MLTIISPKTLVVTTPPRQNSRALVMSVAKLVTRQLTVGTRNPINTTTKKIKTSVSVTMMHVQFVTKWDILPTNAGIATERSLEWTMTQKSSRARHSSLSRMDLHQNTNLQIVDWVGTILTPIRIANDSWRVLCLAWRAYLYAEHI